MSASGPSGLLVLKILSGISLECQTVWIQIRLDVSSSQIWVKTRPRSAVGSESHCRSRITARSPTFVAIDHEIISTVILFLPLIQEGLLSVQAYYWSKALQMEHCFLAITLNLKWEF